MHNRCRTDCGGNLVKHSEDNEQIKYICDKCGRIVTQRKRKPNIETRRIYLHKHEWELIAFAVDKAAETQVISDQDKYAQLVELRDKILDECKPRIKPAKKHKERKKKRKHVEETLAYEDLKREVNWDNLLE